MREKGRSLDEIECFVEYFFKFCIYFNSIHSASKADEWSKHIFVLFADRLCYLVQSLEDKGDSRINDELHQKSLAAHENSLGSQGDDLVDESAANSSTINK